MIADSPCPADLSKRTFERILLIKPSSLGDVIHALPVVHGLRRRYPRARIDWLVATAIAPLIEGHRDIDNLVLFDRRRFGSLWRRPRAAVEFVQLLQSLRAVRYDLVIDLQGLFRSGFLARISSAGVRIGFRDAREGAHFFYTHHLPRANGDVHAVDRNFSVARFLGFESNSLDFSLPLRDVDREDTDRLLRNSGIRGGRPLLAVAPGARWETKRWAPERIAATINALHTEREVDCVLLGGDNEAGLCTSIAGRCRPSPATLAGRTSLRQLACVIERANVVLCHDSGVAHLAVALNRPLVCLSGPTNPLRTGPYGRIDDVVRVSVPCSPCYLRRLRQCPHDHRCMNELSPDTVLAALYRALASQPLSMTATP